MKPSANRRLENKKTRAIMQATQTLLSLGFQYLFPIGLPRIALTYSCRRTCALVLPGYWSSSEPVLWSESHKEAPFEVVFVVALAI